MNVDDYLDQYLEIMPQDAPNHLCWRFSVNEKYAQYLSWCLVNHLQAETKKIFVNQILAKAIWIRESNYPAHGHEISGAILQRPNYGRA